MLVILKNKKNADGVKSFEFWVHENGDEYSYYELTATIWDEFGASCLKKDHQITFGGGENNKFPEFCYIAHDFDRLVEKIKIRRKILNKHIS
jgi:hypothetical protein